MRKYVKRYQLLKHELKRRGLAPYSYLSEVSGIPKRALEARMQGYRPWRSNEMYLMMELIGQPSERLSMFFPRSDYIGCKEVA